MLRVGEKVKIKDTNMIGTVIRHGGQGLYNLDITTPHSAFDRTVYGEWELEKFGGINNENCIKEIRA